MAINSKVVYIHLIHLRVLGFTNLAGSDATFLHQEGPHRDQPWVSDQCQPRLEECGVIVIILSDQTNTKLHPFCFFVIETKYFNCICEIEV